MSSRIPINVFTVNIHYRERTTFMTDIHYRECTAFMTDINYRECTTFMTGNELRQQFLATAVNLPLYLACMKTL